MTLFPNTPLSAENVGLLKAGEPFERHPALASWIERLGHTAAGLSLGEWMTFIGALNAALVSERRPALFPPAPIDWTVVGPKLVEALERIADPRNIHFAGDAQVVASRALDAVDLNIKAALAAAQPGAK